MTSDEKIELRAHSFPKLLAFCIYIHKAIIKERTSSRHCLNLFAQGQQRIPFIDGLVEIQLYHIRNRIHTPLHSSARSGSDVLLSTQNLIECGHSVHARSLATTPCIPPKATPAFSTTDHRLDMQRLLCNTLHIKHEAKPPMAEHHSTRMVLFATV